MTTAKSRSAPRKRKPRAISNAEFAKRMVLLARTAGRFRPTATYDADGDCIEFLAKPDPFYAERVDGLVTVYFSQDTGEIVGALIKGVARFCRQFSRKNPGFRLVLENGPVRLDHLFLARLWSSAQDPQAVQTLTYRKLIDVAADTVIEGEMPLARSPETH